MYLNGNKIRSSILHRFTDFYNHISLYRQVDAVVIENELFYIDTVPKITGRTTKSKESFISDILIKAKA